MHIGRRQFRLSQQCTTFVTIAHPLSVLLSAEHIDSIDIKSTSGERRTVRHIESVTGVQLISVCNYNAGSIVCAMTHLPLPTHHVCTYTAGPNVAQVGLIELKAGQNIIVCIGLKEAPCGIWQVGFSTAGARCTVGYPYICSQMRKGEEIGELQQKLNMLAFLRFLQYYPGVSMALNGSFFGKVNADLLCLAAKYHIIANGL